MIIKEQDLYAKIYPEILDEIKRGNQNLVTNAINNAVDLAKSYMSRFDMEKLFGTGDTNPTVQSDLLKSLLVDITCWYIVRLANPNLNLEIFRADFEDAQKNLDKINAGKLSPQGWPLKQVTTEGTHPGATVAWSSNIKRGNHF